MSWSRLDGLTIRQLRVFCTVARCLSYTLAAQELGCRQPTVSALVAELERITQLTLLEQWGKHLALTDEGRELYVHAQQVVAAEDEAWQAIIELHGAVQTGQAPLSIAADTTVGTYVLPHLLGTFHQLRPDILFHLRVANRAEVRARLLAREVDLVIAGRPPAVDGLIAELFLANPLVVVAAPGHPLVGQTHIPLARLAEEAFLLREIGSGTRAAVEEVFEMAGVPLKAEMVLGHVEAIKQAVAAGLGVSAFSELAVKREVKYHQLAILDVEHFPIKRNWYIARLADRPLHSSVSVFIEFLRAYRRENE